MVLVAHAIVAASQLWVAEAPVDHEAGQRLAVEQASAKSSNAAATVLHLYDVARRKLREHFFGRGKHISQTRSRHYGDT